MQNIAIKAENISKCYRVGMKENSHDTLAKSVLHFIKRPLENYKKYRSLYHFDDIDPDQAEESPDIIWALRDVSFEIRKSEVVGVVGINGAGKSTLLKILSKITTPTRGRATIFGKVSSLLEVGTGFHPELTGRENVYLNGTIIGMRKKEIDAKFDEIVDFSGVEKFIDTPVKRYSSGMRVRLAFSVAATLEPDILIIDEVLAVGDARFQKKCLNKMQDVGRRGRTVIFVSHNMPAVTRLCSRTILLGGGKIVADGPSADVVGHYLNAENGGTSERIWPAQEAPGDDVVRLLSMRIRTQSGLVTETVDISQTFCVELNYEVLKDGYELQVHFHVLNQEGINAFMSIENDPDWRRKPRPSGRYTSVAYIPGDLLAEGTYFIQPRMSTLSPTVRRVAVDDAVALQVIDSMDGRGARADYAGHLYGVVRPLLKWNTQYVSTSAGL